jgi:predicted enzyme related to lactoylglutathione lyase
MLKQFGLIACLILSLSANGFAQTTAKSDKGFQITQNAFVAIKVENADVAAHWYGQTFDLEIANSIDAEDGKYRIRILSGENLTVEIIELRGAETPPDSHFGHFKMGFYVDDLDAAFEWIDNSRGHNVTKIFSDEALGLRSFVFRDPFNNRLQLFQICRPECGP